MKQKKDLNKLQGVELNSSDKNEGLDVYDLMRLCFTEKSSVDYFLEDTEISFLKEKNKDEQLAILKEIGIDYDQLADS